MFAPMSAPLQFREWRAIRIIVEAAPNSEFRLKDFTAETPLEELGFDSIQFVGVCVELENAFRVSLDCDALGEVGTVGDLVQLVATANTDRRGQA